MQQTLEDLKRQRLAQYMDESEAKAKEEQDFKDKVQSLENAIKPRMSPQALSRFNNLKMAHPDIAIKSLAIIAQTDRMNVSDDEYRNLIQRLQPMRRDIKITRK